MSQKILILANGLVAYHFLERLNDKRNNREYIVVSQDENLKKFDYNSIEFFQVDPTSYLRIRKIWSLYNINYVFIILSSLEETGEALKNIRRLSKRVRVILVDMWSAYSKLEDSSTHVIDANELIANRLYDFLPDTPTLAQSVGLGEGEIIEVLVPFGSPFSYRHIGSIPQVKWKIAAIYRNNQLIMPTNATMIRPQDSLLLIGKPQVLRNVYRKIKSKEGTFPEPFGKNFYLLLDMELDESEAIEYLKEAKYLLEHFEQKELYVRVKNPASFEVLEAIRKFENNKIKVLISYEEFNTKEFLIDIEDFDIGLIFISNENFSKEDISSLLYEQKRLVYIYGDTPLQNIKEAAILLSDDKIMEAISSTSFFVSEALDIKLCLCNFEPSGDFDKHKIAIEHYETLSHIFRSEIKIVEKEANPIRELAKMKNILLIIPFIKDILEKDMKVLIKKEVYPIIFRYVDHPKLLIPTEEPL